MIGTDEWYVLEKLKIDSHLYAIGKILFYEKGLFYFDDFKELFQDEEKMEHIRKKLKQKYLTVRVNNGKILKKEILEVKPNG